MCEMPWILGFDSLKVSEMYLFESDLFVKHRFPKIENFYHRWIQYDAVCIEFFL